MRCQGYKEADCKWLKKDIQRKVIWIAIVEEGPLYFFHDVWMGIFALHEAN